MTATNPRDQQTGNPYPQEQGGTFRPENEPEGADLGNEDEEEDQEADDNDRRQPGENATRDRDGEDMNRREPDDEDAERPDNIGRSPLR
jgi:hypothetical protein